MFKPGDKVKSKLTHDLFKVLTIEPSISRPGISILRCESLYSNSNIVYAFYEDEIELVVKEKLTFKKLLANLH